MSTLSFCDLSGIERDLSGRSKNLPRPRHTWEEFAERDRAASEAREEWHRSHAAREDAPAAWMRQKQRDQRRAPSTSFKPSRAVEYDDQRCAWHEAAHATLAHIQGVCVLRSSIVPDKHGNRASVLTSPKATDLQSLLFLVAGREGEIMGLGDAGSGDGEDTRKALEIALRLEGNDATKAEEMLRGYRYAARKLLTKYRPAVEALVQALLQRRTIEWGDVDALINGALAKQREARKHQWRRRRRNARRPTSSTGAGVGRAVRVVTAETARTPAERELFERVHTRNDGVFL